MGPGVLSLFIRGLYIHDKIDRQTRKTNKHILSILLSTSLRVFVSIAQALRVALLRAPPNTFFEDTFMWSGEDTSPAAEFPSGTELPREDAFRRHFSRSRISPRHRITSRRRFSKTLFPQPNFSPPPNCPPKTLFEDTFSAAEFMPATELSLPRWKRIIPPVPWTSATVRCWKGMINKKRS